MLKAQLPEVASATPLPSRCKGDSSDGYVHEAGPHASGKRNSLAYMALADWQLVAPEDRHISTGFLSGLASSRVASSSPMSTCRIICKPVIAKSQLPQRVLNK